MHDTKTSSRQSTTVLLSSAWTKSTMSRLYNIITITIVYSVISLVFCFFHLQNAERGLLFKNLNCLDRGDGDLLYLGHEETMQT